MPRRWMLRDSRQRLAAINSTAQHGTASVDMVGGGIVFNITCRVGIAEMREWTPERITAFFNGIARVVCAGGDVTERDAETTTTR